MRTCELVAVVVLSVTLGAACGGLFGERCGGVVAALIFIPRFDSLLRRRDERRERGGWPRREG